MNLATLFPHNYIVETKGGVEMVSSVYEINDVSVGGRGRGRGSEERCYVKLLRHVVSRNTWRGFWFGVNAKHILKEARGKSRFKNTTHIIGGPQVRFTIIVCC